MELLLSWPTSVTSYAYFLGTAVRLSDRQIRLTDSQSPKSDSNSPFSRMHNIHQLLIHVPRIFVLIGSNGQKLND